MISACATSRTGRRMEMSGCCVWGGIGFALFHAVLEKSTQRLPWVEFLKPTKRRTRIGNEGASALDVPDQARVWAAVDIGGIVVCGEGGFALFRAVLKNQTGAPLGRIFKGNQAQNARWR